MERRGAVYAYRLDNADDSGVHNVLAVPGRTRVTYAMIQNGVHVRTAPLSEMRFMKPLEGQTVPKAVRVLKRHAKRHGTTSKTLKKFLVKAAQKEES